MPPGAADLDPLARSDREDELALWLDDRGVADAWELAPALVAAELDGDRLGAVVDRLPPPATGPALAWLAASLTSAGLIAEIVQATGRISALVDAVKRYSYLDQAPEQEVDVHEGLESTLTMLDHPLKGIEVVREYDRTLPRITAFGSELNQVWTNLIDNAADALPGPAELTVRTAREGDVVLVEIGDDGPGIPPRDPRPRLRAVLHDEGGRRGHRAGARHRPADVVDRHHGEVRVESRPGETRVPGAAADRRTGGLSAAGVCPNPRPDPRDTPYPPGGTRTQMCASPARPAPRGAIADRPTRRRRRTGGRGEKIVQKRHWPLFR